MSIIFLTKLDEGSKPSLCKPLFCWFNFISKVFCFNLWPVEGVEVWPRLSFFFFKISMKSASLTCAEVWVEIGDPPLETLLETFPGGWVDLVESEHEVTL